MTCATCGVDLRNDAVFCHQCGSRVAAPESGPSAGRGRAPSKFRRIIQAVVALILLVGILTFYRDAFRTYHPVIERQPEFSEGAGSRPSRISSVEVSARIEGPFIIMSLKDVVQNTIVRFHDPEGVQTVPILAYFTPSGRLVTAMSISENCRSTDFYLEGEDMHCANCPSYWNASSLEAYACCQKYYPDPIPSTVLGDEVRIETSVVRRWQARS